MDTMQYDLIVLGSGAAGFAAATTATLRGLKVLLIEKDSRFGGTSAISGGAIWIYGSDQARAAGIEDSAEAMRTYLRTIIGPDLQPTLVDAYIEHGHEALRWLEKHSELAYSLRPVSPDYYPDAPGATEAGRALEIGEYDGRRLGAHFRNLKMPPPGMLLFGGMMVNRLDIQHFLSFKRSPASLWHCLKLMGRYAVDRLKHPRGTRLTTGNALIARLATSAFEHGCQLWLDCTSESLIVEDGCVRGLMVSHKGQTLRIRSRAGVVLATGGFAAGVDAAKYRPHGDSEHLSMSPPANNGDSLRLSHVLDAATGEHLAANFFWAPVSECQHADGSRERFPHLVTDRAKPGVIAVNRAGQRFVNESNSYHHFVQTMFATGNTRCWLICDATAMGKYGMGLARPSPVNNSHLVECGYLFKADSAEQLASAIGVDPQGLSHTLAHYNADARQGQDSAFGKGSNAYNRYMGDPGQRLGACNAPLLKAPWYAIELHTGDLGSAMGLVTDHHANVLDRSGAPIPGLYAAGNDMNSVMRGTYPGPGITLGPALTFGYLAASHAAQTLGTPTPVTLKE
ncbi:FAD-dependent oxidoreductase [Pseudomonas sp. 3A(2025)]